MIATTIDRAEFTGRVLDNPHKISKCDFGAKINGKNLGNQVNLGTKVAHYPKPKEKLDFPARRLHLGGMKLILSTHNIRLTKAIEDHVVKQLEKFDHFDKRTIDARVTLEHDHTRAAGKQLSCSIRLRVHGPDLFAEHIESDLYAAIDKVAKKIEQQIRKRHNKWKARKHKIAARSKQTRQEAEEE
jgi:putative sigma-54 modulation protein